MSATLVINLPAASIQMPGYRFGRRLPGAFVDRYCAPVTVNRRPDGTLWIVDGWARVQGALAAGRTHVPAVVVDLDVEGEKRLFLRVNRITTRYER